jgi:hypothetical protein
MKMADKDVTVSVVSGAIQVSPDTLAMGKDRNVKIFWTFDKATSEAGWQFAADTGIVFKDTGNTQFTDKELKDSGKKYKWNDANSDNNLYNYTVNLVNGTQTLSKDPAIQNQGDSA